jgi:ATP-dependent RNA helicase DDX54/DBP10
LTASNIQNTYIYGALDQQARRIQLARFRSGKERILIVTDVAARGIDIPLLDNVINYDFAPTCKTFIHRVGRVARAGRTGKAWSLVGPDEVPYMLDLQLFTSRPLVFASTFLKNGNVEPDYTRDIVYGYIPEALITLEIEEVIKINRENVTISSLATVVKNSYKMYYKSRPTAAKESYKRAKEIAETSIGIHPMLSKEVGEEEVSRTFMVESISKFRPAETVFEVGKKGMKTKEATLMQKRRSQLLKVIDAVKEKRKETENKRESDQQTLFKHQHGDIPLDDESMNAFTTIIGNSKKRRREMNGDSLLNLCIESYRDEEHYMKYRPTDADDERGYAIENGKSAGASFLEKAQAAAFDLVADDDSGMRKKGSLVWDSKKRNYVRPTIGSDNKKRIKTESGALIPASFKSKRYVYFSKP